MDINSGQLSGIKQLLVFGFLFISLIIPFFVISFWQRSENMDNHYQTDWMCVGQLRVKSRKLSIAGRLVKNAHRILFRLESVQLEGKLDWIREMIVNKKKVHNERGNNERNLANKPSSFIPRDKRPLWLLTVHKSVIFNVFIMTDVHSVSRLPLFYKTKCKGCVSVLFDA